MAITTAINTGDTICAISTPPGCGGIAVIRISGDNALQTADAIFQSPRQKKIADAAPYTMLYGNVVTTAGEIIDTVVAAVYRAPHSFTGEDVVEITCHGSEYIQQKILELLITAGCRMATPGEYTRRAYLNKKIDLAQAEGIVDVIAARTAASHRLAMTQMRGEFSSKLNELRQKMIDFASLIELELDFSEEEVEFADRTRLFSLANELQSRITRLVESFTTGNAIKNGIPVAIAGETNAGKSTLLNKLLGEEKAIVSDIHGTTRDTIEDTITIDGILYRFIDTAGIRETKDQIEKLGIERTYKKIEQSAIVLWLSDINEELSPEYAEIQKEKDGKNIIVLLTKCDLKTPAEIASSIEKTTRQTGNETKTIAISAQTGDGMEELYAALKTAARHPEYENDIVVSNIRHYEALVQARTAMQRVTDGLQTSLPGDLLAQDIREAMHYIGEITGEITPADLLQTIFSRFCIGK